MAGNLTDVRYELVKRFGEREGVKTVRFGFPSLAEPFSLHLGLDWATTTTRDTNASNRRWGFYARYFMPAPTVEDADLYYGAFMQSVLDWQEEPGSVRMEDGTNMTVVIQNRGGPPLQMGGERKVVRKDFYVEVQVAHARVPRA